MLRRFNPEIRKSLAITVSVLSIGGLAAKGTEILAPEPACLIKPSNPKSIVECPIDNVARAGAFIVYEGLGSYTDMVRAKFDHNPVDPGAN